MTEKSFHDLDYIIEINETRVDQNTSAYQKVLDRLTNIILVYSAIAIFLVPIIQDVVFSTISHWLLFICFILFAALFVISLFFTIRLIIPVEVAYLDAPSKYYVEFRTKYESTGEYDKKTIGTLIKASYISELEDAVNTNMIVFRKKSSFYYNGLMFALLSVVPYIICLGFHISQKEDKIQKVEIVSPEIKSNLLKIEFMGEKNNKPQETTSSTTTTQTTRLPGVVDSQVIQSKPVKLKENSQTPSNSKDTGTREK